MGPYSTGSKLTLPQRAIMEDYKVTKTWQIMILYDCIDEKVKGARVKIRTGQ